LAPTVQPRATEHIPEMRAIIEKLVAGGFAYVAEDHVLFSPAAMNEANSVMPRYGALSKRSLDEMIAGARVDVAPYKRDNTDFVLWKPSKPGEPSWPSPAGIKVEGRPGWHIECSAMAWKHLGEKFDIHGGGIDLVFPHHENELAQTCCAFHSDRMANVWMHNGFLQIESEKMSKSLGNFFTIRDMLADWPGEVLRLNMLKTHYRSPLDWTLKGAEESAKTLDDWYAIAADAEAGEPSAAMVEALYDDLNTAQTMAILHGLRNAAASGGERERGDFAASLRLLGFLSVSAAEWKRRKQQASGIDAGEVDRLIAERAAARARKDFKESDRIRDELAAMGVTIKDGKDADGKPVTTWEIA
jgi:cysteinyl-tRNA synthetase